jgi:hypothetical protein
MAHRQIVSLKHLTQLAIVASTLFGSAIALGTATPAAAESPSYPWCVQGSIYRCWYMTREQCEEAVNYHGFCVTDPNVPRRPGEKVRGETAPA